MAFEIDAVDKEQAKKIAWQSFVWITVIALITSPIFMYLI